MDPRWRSVGLAILGGSLLGRLFSAMKRETGTVIEYITQGDAGIRSVEARDGNTYFRRNPREIKDIYGLVLHQMAFDYESRGTDPDKYTGVRAHFIVLSDGSIYQLHPLERYLYASSSLNAWTVAVEVAGNFQRKAGDWYKPEKFGQNEAPTEAQIRSLKFLVRWLRGALRSGGSDLRAIYTHGQGSKAKRGCPGPQIWSQIVPWAASELGIPNAEDESFGSGQPVPDYYREWDEGTFV